MFSSYFLISSLIKSRVDFLNSLSAGFGWGSCEAHNRQDVLRCPPFHLPGAMRILLDPNKFIPCRKTMLQIFKIF